MNRKNMDEAKAAAISFELLKTAAEAAGIDLYGIVDLDLLSSLSSYFSSLKPRDIAFNRTDPLLRLDPKTCWNRTQGVIAFAVAYADESKVLSDSGGKTRGIIARFARFRDYHSVLREKADVFMKYVTKEVLCSWRTHVDSGPLSDRMAAYSAGLGFIGKNRFLISEEHGSFLFLGQILVNIPLKPAAAPAGENSSACMDCDKCLKACPQNVYANGFFDYEKCISYTTQKGRGGLPSSYLYGCDICQDVCPFNREKKRTAKKSSCEIAVLRTADACPDADAVLEMDENEFSCIYADTPVAFGGLSSLQANARILKEDCMNSSKSKK